MEEWGTVTQPFFPAIFIEQVALWHGVPVSDVLSRKRDARTYAARRDVILHLHERNWSSKRIGRLLQRDHSTVLHAVRGER